ncbi:unnamed protein product, partial [Heterosigma akashiwo]
DKALVKGPKYGYYPEPPKGVMVAKKGKEERAREVFAEYPDLEIVSHHRFLGGCIGASAGVEEAYVKKKVATWVECVRHLARAAEKFSQSAYVALTISLQSEWKFLQRLIPESSAWFRELNDVIQHEFIPALLARWQFSEAEMELVELPFRWGGLGILDPTKAAQSFHELSFSAISMVRDAILDDEPLDVP